MRRRKDTVQGETGRTSNGWDVFDRKTFAPIHLRPNDMLTCTYAYRTPRGRVVTEELAAYHAERDEVIDTAIIARPDARTLEALGLKSGLAGVFGESIAQA